MSEETAPRQTGEDDATIRIRLNGEERAVPGGLTVAGLLEELGVDGRGVAVERNREVVHREARDEVPVEAGDVVEVVQFVGGG
jgi:thiamine biosynthesis protein ThiS